MGGRLVHFELPANDPARARSFWTGLFGWRFDDDAFPGTSYWLTRTGEDQGGAIYPTDGPVRGPIVYFDCEDIEAALARVGEHGGETGEKQPIPHVGWFAMCADTEGNTFGLFQADESVTA
jgi:predicted enzyme related to lactoylglutathione lyase